MEDKLKVKIILAIDASINSMYGLNDFVNNELLTILKNQAEIMDSDRELLIYPIIYNYKLETPFKDFISPKAIESLKADFSRFGASNPLLLIDKLEEIFKAKQYGGLLEPSYNELYYLIHLTNSLNESLYFDKRYDNFFHDKHITKFVVCNEFKPCLLRLVDSAEAITDSNLFMKLDKIIPRKYIPTGRAIDSSLDEKRGLAKIEYPYNDLNNHYNDTIDNLYYFTKENKYKYKNLQQVFLIIDESKYSTDALLDKARELINDFISINNTSDYMVYEIIPIRFNKVIINPPYDVKSLGNVEFTRFKHYADQNLEALIRYLEEILDYNNPMCLLKSSQYSPKFILFSNKLDWTSSLAKRYFNILSRYYDLDIVAISDYRYNMNNDNASLLRFTRKIDNIYNTASFYYEDLVSILNRSIYSYKITFNENNPISRFYSSYIEVEGLIDNLNKRDENTILFIPIFDMNVSLHSMEYECFNLFYNSLEAIKANELLLTNGNYLDILPIVLNTHLKYMSGRARLECGYNDRNYLELSDALNKILRKEAKGGFIRDNTKYYPVIALFTSSSYNSLDSFMPGLLDNELFNKSLRLLYTTNRDSNNSFMSTNDSIFFYQDFYKSLEYVLKGDYWLNRSKLVDSLKIDLNNSFNQNLALLNGKPDSKINEGLFNLSLSLSHIVTTGMCYRVEDDLNNLIEAEVNKSLGVIAKASSDSLYNSDIDSSLETKEYELERDLTQRISLDFNEAEIEGKLGLNDSKDQKEKDDLEIELKITEDMFF